jgi:uncharacterized protein YcfL
MKKINKKIIAAFCFAIFACSGSSAAIVFIDIPDVSIDGTNQVVSVEFGTNESESRAVKWSTTLTSNPPTQFGRSIHFYWYDHLIVAESTDSGFTGLSWQPDDYPGFGVIEVEKLQNGDTMTDSFVNDARLVGGTSGYGDWQYDSSIAYMGARFYDGEWSNLYYGWIEAKYSNNELTIYSIAYDSEGDQIVAGAVPEPSSYSLLLGLWALATLTCTRRRFIQSQ